MKNCICLICYKPNIKWFDFLYKFKNYDIYVIIDDNNIDYRDVYKQYENIKVVQIPENECIVNGFTNMCSLTIPKQITGWDKATYYFSSISTCYDNIWMMEDDVFFYNEQTLINIDSQYPIADLISNEYYNTENTDNYGNKWVWRNSIDINFEPPYYNCMCCIIRVSSNLLLKIKNYANTNNKLVFLEALFPSVCKKNNMIYYTPDELKNIFYKDCNINNINKTNVYHPIKNINYHIAIRNVLDMDV